MKKFLISIMLLAITSICAHGIENQKANISQNVFAPQWSDVCPYAAYHSVNVNKKYFKADKKYWKERRIQFNKEIAACNNVNGDINQCYKDIVAIENDRTVKWQGIYYEEKESRTKKGTIAVVAATILGIATCFADWW